MQEVIEPREAARSPGLPLGWATLIAGLLLAALALSVVTAGGRPVAPAPQYQVVKAPAAEPQPAMLVATYYLVGTQEQAEELRSEIAASGAGSAFVLVDDRPGAIDLDELVRRVEAPGQISVIDLRK